MIEELGDSLAKSCSMLCQTNDILKVKSPVIIHYRGQRAINNSPKMYSEYNAPIMGTIIMSTSELSYVQLLTIKLTKKPSVALSMALNRKNHEDSLKYSPGQIYCNVRWIISIKW